MISAIQTRYAGCHFRSRLEARWAVFFDALNIPWQYEPEGFSRRSREDELVTYLPDFYLPETGTWVEVKGSHAQLLTDMERIAIMLDWGSPLPGIDESWASERGLLVLGPVPRWRDSPPLHALIQHHKGLSFTPAAFGLRGPLPIIATGRQLRPWGRPEWQWQCDSSCGVDPKNIPPCLDEEWQFADIDDGWGDTWERDLNMPPYATWRTLFDAYDAARSARFEHGQSGAT